MGIDLTGLRALNFMRRLEEVNFQRTVMLGRQEVHFTRREFEYVNRRSGCDISFDERFGIGNFVEPLLAAFGARKIDSIDAANYEGATIIQDFNLPVDKDLHNSYTCYLDFGSMEHVFSPKDVVSNINALLVEGGTALMVTNANGFCGHGFYQFAPEFFYNAFSEKNGFCNTQVFLVDLLQPKLWNHISDPELLKSRNTVPAGKKFYIICLTQKTFLSLAPRAQQSDYLQAAWAEQNHRHINSERRSIFSRVRPFVNPFIFARFRHLFHSFHAARVFGHQRRRFDPDTVQAHELPFLITRSHPSVSATA